MPGEVQENSSSMGGTFPRERPQTWQWIICILVILISLFWIFLISFWTHMNLYYPMQWDLWVMCRAKSHLLWIVCSLSPTSFIWCLKILVLEDTVQSWISSTHNLHTAWDFTDLYHILSSDISFSDLISVTNLSSIFQCDIFLLLYCKDRSKPGC